MNKEPKYCVHCSGELIPDKEFKEPWQDKLVCVYCGCKCLITYGDQMGGAKYCYVDWEKI